MVFSAHGVPKSVPAEATRRKLFYLDATCPLVSKVHREAEQHFARGRHILLIGHAGHPEVVGTMGQLPDGAVTLVEDEAQARLVAVPAGRPLAFITQTTLSVDDTAGIVAALRDRFPDIPPRRRRTSATPPPTARPRSRRSPSGCELMVVVGAPNSSNSLRLVEVAERAGCPRAVMVQRGRDLDLGLADGVGSVGITAGASAPEVLVEEVLARLAEHFDIAIEEVVVAEERITFKLPAGLQQA